MPTTTIDTATLNRLKKDAKLAAAIRSACLDSGAGVYTSRPADEYRIVLTAIPYEARLKVEKAWTYVFTKPQSATLARRKARGHGQR